MKMRLSTSFGTRLYSHHMKPRADGDPESGECDRLPPIEVVSRRTADCAPQVWSSLSTWVRRMTEASAFGPWGLATPFPALSAKYQRDLSASWERTRAGHGCCRAAPAW